MYQGDGHAAAEAASGAANRTRHRPLPRGADAIVAIVRRRAAHPSARARHRQGSRRSPGA